MTLIFNHIPKTGGITFRGILNKVYKPENIYSIDSLDIADSIQSLKSISVNERSKYKVIAGHGADLISEIIDMSFRITILREPVSLFISQYNFLKTDSGTIFFDEVKALENIENYLEYAINKGQDNLMTRYLSGSMNWLINPEIPIPDMEKEGDQFLEKAIMKLSKYNAVLDLKTFDEGVFALSQKLGWKRIPIYRPQNQNKTRKKTTNLSPEFEDRLNYALRFDIELYNWFNNTKLDIANQINPSLAQYKKFILRQKILNFTNRFFTP